MRLNLEQSPQVPDAFTWHEASCSSSAGRVRRIVAGWAGVAWWCQISAIGLVLVGIDQNRPGSPGLFGSTLAVATIATLLSFAFLRSLSETSHGWPGPARATRFVWSPIAVLLAFAVLMTLQALMVSTVLSSDLLARWAIVSAAVGTVCEHLHAAPIAVAIVGEGSAAAELACDLAGHHGSDRVDVVAILDAVSDRDLARLVDLTIQRTASVVLLPRSTSEAIVTLVCDRLADTPAHVLLNVSDGAPHGSYRAFLQASAETMLFTDLLPRPIEGRRYALKRGFDLCVASMLLVAVAPVLVLTCIAIRLDSPGPILFRQWRFGQASRPIQVLKLRTMVTSASDTTGAARTVAGDPRVTRIGKLLRKLSIDELPQLFNVLRGDMSIVGPRPHATHMKVDGTYYFDAIRLYRVRHRVLPGITGWAQVNNSRGEVDTLIKARRRLQLDLWYMANWSPLLDIWIIVRTVMGGFLNSRGD